MAISQARVVRPTWFVCITAVAAPAIAQCELLPENGPGCIGPVGSIAAMLRWDPDGAGPTAPLVVMAGDFRAAGNTLSRGVVGFDPASGEFVSLGGGVTGSASCLAVAANGDLLVGGLFTAAGGTAALNVARWNGSSWSALGGGVASTAQGLRAIVGMPNGDVVVAGLPITTGNGLTRWNGTAWTAIPGPAPSLITSLVAQPNGDLFVGGWFGAPGDPTATTVARWDGTSWHPLGSGIAGPGANAGQVRTMVRMPDGALVVGGQFTTAGGAPANSIARWDGTQWTSLGSGLTGVIAFAASMAVLPDGDLIVSGLFTQAGGQPANRYARWNGSAWSPFGAGAVNGAGLLVALADDDVITSGGFELPGPRRWDGTAWRVLRSGFATEWAGGAMPLLRLRDGRMLVATQYLTPNAAAARGLFVHDGSNWAPFGGGVNGYVNCAIELANGHVVVGGLFTEAGGVTVANVARFDGTTWSALGAPVCNGYLTRLDRLPTGDLVASGVFTTIGGTAANRIGRWDGSSWQPLGAGLNNSAMNLRTMPNGDVVAVGLFTNAGGVACNRIARWNGVAWSPLGAGLNNAAYDLQLLPDGELVVSGRFTTAGGVAAQSVARWNGTSWSAFAPGFDGPVEALAVLPDGQLCVGGRFGTAGGQPASRLARWSGTGWLPLTASTFAVGDVVSSLLALPDGQLLVGGSMTSFGAAPAISYLRLTTPCPAVAQAWGVGCAGSGGPARLEATSLPWLGTTATATASALAGTELALAVTGFGTQSLPLQNVLPAAPPGCTLRVTADLLDALVVSNDAVATALPIPGSPALVGITLQQQIVAVNLGLSTVTASNRLSWTIGQF
ncbi:MAG: hypothetical protein MUC36_22590 [Planctomycetes bacterium]|jgi:hypothetical protein|nr:hypothetical protein [Planctomycetota bacterium]